jgi:hypothetical protein
MERIKLFDNFFCNEHQRKIKYIIRSELWKAEFMTNKNNIIINNYRMPNNTFKNFNPDWPFWRIELEENSFFNDILKIIIDEKLNKKFILKRVYAVSQNYEQNSNYHTDYDCDDNKTFTFCYYINENIDDNHDGYFYIKIPNEKMIMSIAPIDNRVVYFPSNYVHRGSGFNKNVLNLRICITWKFILENG